MNKASSDDEDSPNGSITDEVHIYALTALYHASLTMRVKIVVLSAMDTWSWVVLTLPEHHEVTSPQFELAEFPFW